MNQALRKLTFPLPGVWLLFGLLTEALWLPHSPEAQAQGPRVLRNLEDLGGSAPAGGNDISYWDSAPSQTTREVARCCGIPTPDVHFDLEYRCPVTSQTASCFHSAVHATNGRMAAAYRGITQIVSGETSEVVRRLCRHDSGPNSLELEATCTRRLLDQRNPEFLRALNASHIPTDAFRIRLNRWLETLSQRSLIVLACKRAVGGVTVTEQVVGSSVRAIARQTGPADPECSTLPVLRAAAFDSSDFTRPAPSASRTPIVSVSPSPSSPDSGPSGFPSLRSGEATEAQFDSCMLGYSIGVEASRRNLSPAQSCNSIRSTSLEPFHEEIGRIMARSNLQTYFELLRMEALARFMAVQQHWVGAPVTDLPSSCAPFAHGLRELQQNSTRVSSTQTPEFAEALQSQARFALRLRDEASRLTLIPAQECSGDRGPGGSNLCTPNPDYERAQAELSRIRAVLSETIGAFPVLGSGRTAADAEPWQQLQAAPGFANHPTGSEAFRSNIARARAAIAADIRASLEKFCGDRPPEGISGNELVQIPELTQAVTRSFPQFNAVQACVREKAERTEGIRNGLHLMATGGCLLGAIATEGALAPACGALSVGLGYQGYAAARERLYWTERCNAAGGTVCSDRMYAEARSNYDSAVMMLGASIAGAALDLPILTRQLRGAATWMSASRMQAVSAELREAASLGDDAARTAALRRIAGEVSQETAPAASKAAIRQKLTERMGEASARGRFPCLFR